MMAPLAAASSSSDASNNPAAVRDTCLASTQCLNGGVCADPDDEFPHKHCVCRPQFHGVHCESHCPLPCHNGGQCRMRDGTSPEEYVHHKSDESNFVCRCRGHYTGELCQVPYKNCGTDDGLRCLNGGACRAPDREGGLSTCDCPSGFDGETCEVRLVPGADHPLNTRGGKAGFGVLLILLALVLAWFLILNNSGKFESLTTPPQSLMRRYRPVKQKPTEEVREMVNIV